MGSRVWEVFKKHVVKAKDRQGRSYTHTFLNGGSFIYSDEEQEQDRLFAAIEADLRDRKPFFINEIATEVFKLFLDMDFYHTERLTDAEIEDLNLHIFNCFQRFFPADACLENPRLFEAIVLSADAKQLCDQEAELRNLVAVHGRFSAKSILMIHDGRVRETSSETIYDVQWATPTPPNGVYQCVIDADAVKLVANGTFVFTNVKMHSDEFMRIRRTGSVPSNAVSVTAALQQSGQWEHTASTIFVLDDGSYFLNSERNADGLVKHGLHIIFPWCLVGIEQALYMREALVDKLSIVYGKNFAPSGWSTVVDNAVYGTGKGLRMYGAHKTTSCPECPKRDKKEDMDCNVKGCNQRGKIDAGRPYLLHSVFNNGMRDRVWEKDYMQKTIKLLRTVSIRTVAKHPTAGWTCYKGCPQFGDMLKTVIKGGETTHKIMSREAIFREDAKIKRAAANTVEVQDPEAFRIFERHIRARFVRQYQNLRVTNVRKSDKGFYFISVAGEGQHWCTNKNPPADHKSSTIFFQCTKHGICVRCRCPKPSVEGRKKGPCRDYHSSYKPLDVKEAAKLFPDSLTVSVSGKAYLELGADTATRVTQHATTSSKKPRK